jgi:nucleoid DNA-binding protein
LNKADLAEAVRSFHGGVTGAEALRIVDTIFRSAADGLAGGSSLRIRRFGSLEVRSRCPRRGSDLRTGRIFVTGAHRTLFFRPARGLLESLQY